MALRTPLVLGDDGIPQQLQTGDTLNAPQAGGDQIVLTNNDGSTVVIGAPVYTDATGSYKRGQANAASTAKVIGLQAKSPSVANGATGAVAVNGPMTATTGQWDAVTGGSGGLTAGSLYFLDPSTAGKLTVTPPATVGQLVCRIGLALSTTILLIDVRDPILL